MSGIEKASRDLQRCTVSFGRYKNLLNEEIEESYKRVKQVIRRDLLITDGSRL